MQNISKFLLISGLSVTLTSCGAVNDPYGNQNPNNYPNSQNYPNNNSVYKAGDGAVYGRGEVYRDRNGNVYENGRVVRQGDVYGQPGILSRNGNQTVYYPNTNQKRLPPGQAKKIYGGKAKDYAPGQVKKRNGDYKKYEEDREFNDDKNYSKKEHKQKNKGGKRDHHDDD